MTLEFNDKVRQNLKTSVKENGILFLGIYFLAILASVLYVTLVNNNSSEITTNDSFEKLSLDYVGFNYSDFILNGTANQFLLYLGVIFLALFGTFFIVSGLKRFNYLQSTRVRQILSSHLWYLLVIWLMVATYIRLYEERGVPPIFDPQVGTVSIGDTLPMFVFWMSAVYAIITINIHYFKLDYDEDSNKFVKVLSSTQQAIPSILVYFSFLSFLTNLPYFGTRFVFSVYSLGRDSTTINTSTTIQANFLSGLLILSMLIILPRLLIGIWKSFIKEQSYPDDTKNRVPTRSYQWSGKLNLLFVILGIAGILYMISFRFLFNISDISSPSGMIQQKVTGGLFNPFYVDIRNVLKAPDDVHRFGTDQLGRDLYSRLVFGMGFLITYSMYIIAGRFVLTLGFFKLKDYLPSTIIRYTRTTFSSLPNYFVLIFFSPVLVFMMENYELGNNSLQSLFWIIFLTSVFSWSGTYQLFEQFQSKFWVKSKLQRFIIGLKILLLSLPAVIIELVLLSYVYQPSQRVLLVGSDLQSAVSSFPTENTWLWQYPLLVVGLSYTVLLIIGTLISLKRTDNNSQEILYPQSEEISTSQ